MIINLNYKKNLKNLNWHWQNNSKAAPNKFLDALKSWDSNVASHPAACGN